MKISRKHPLNPEGRFWIDQDVCLSAQACIYEAPDNIRVDEETGLSYVTKQPETDDELSALRNAIRCCAYEAIVEIEDQ